MNRTGTLLLEHRLLTPAAHLLFCVAFAYLAAQILNHCIVSSWWKSPVHAMTSRHGLSSKAEREGRPRRGIKQYAMISKRNIFNSEANNKKPKNKKPPVPPKPEKSPLEVVLLGTATGAPDDSYAVLYDRKTREQDLYQINDFVQDKARILEIDRDRILLQRGDDREVLEMVEPDESIHKRRGRRPRSRGRGRTHHDQNVEVKRLSANSYAISEDQVQKSLDNMNRLMTQIRVVPNFQGGKADGFKVFAIKPRSIFAQLGLRNGDVIRSVNGDPISDPSKAFTLLQGLRDESELSVKITRRGRDQTLNYEIR